jgi:RHS repeat-associated protein
MLISVNEGKEDSGKWLVVSGSGEGMDRNESGTMVPYYYHTNSTGNVTAITDSTGNLVERVDYDIYGMPTFTDYKTDPQNPTMVSNSLIGNSYLFHGRRYDPETNLYYYRARYYDPITGRFLSTDPIAYADSMNLYQAFNMNGFNFVDPWGLKYYIITGRNKNNLFEYVAKTIKRNLLKKYKNLKSDDIKILHFERDKKLIEFLKEEKSDKDKIDGLYIISHSFGAGIALGYGDESIEIERKNNEDYFYYAYINNQKNQAREIVIKTEVGILLTYDLMRLLKKDREKIRHNFTSKSKIIILGCNAGVNNWNFTGGPWWEVLNTENLMSVAQAMLIVTHRPVIAAKAGLNFFIYNNKGEKYSPKEFYEKFGHHFGAHPLDIKNYSVFMETEDKSNFVKFKLKKRR